MITHAPRTEADSYRGGGTNRGASTLDARRAETFHEKKRKEVVGMTLNGSCPADVASELVATLVILVERDPAKILRAYATRLCFYCDAQTDPEMRDQVEEVGAMMRALEHFTREIFTGDDGDVCAQFLYSDLSAPSLGGSPFPPQLSEEELNDLLCGSCPLLRRLRSECRRRFLSDAVAQRQGVVGFQPTPPTKVLLVRALGRVIAVDARVPFVFPVLPRVTLVRRIPSSFSAFLRGRKGFPHVAQLINGCLSSRLSHVRRSAYETLANVALFAKEHKGPKAFEMLMKTRLRRAERNPQLVAVLTALVWEIVFLDEDRAQEERLLGGNTPGSYALMDDLFDKSVQVRLVAFHSIGRLLFHSWIPAGPRVASIGQDPNAEDSQEKAPTGEGDLDHPEEFCKAGLDLSPRSCMQQFSGTTGTRRLGIPRGCDGQGNTGIVPRHYPPPEGVENGQAVSRCAEQALLRLSLILHEPVRKIDSRVRAAARALAEGLRSYRRQARVLLARSTVLIVEHGLANGTLDVLRRRFPPLREQMDESDQEDQLDTETDFMTGGDGNLGVRGGEEIGAFNDETWERESLAESIPGTEALADGAVNGGRSHGEVHDGAEDLRRGEGSAGEEGLGRDAEQYAAAVHFLVKMLSGGDQARVAGAMRQSLANYFDTDYAFWGDCSLHSVEGGCGVDPDAATEWLMGGVDSYQSLLGGG